MTIHRAKRRSDLALMLLVLLGLSLAGCAAQPVTPLPPEDAVRTTASRSITVRTAATPATGLPIEISQGAEQPPAQEHVARATAEPLTAAQMQAVLDRLQPLPASPGDAQAFAFPSAPLPPPRPGQTINIPFPPPTTVPPPVVAASAVEVLRYAPEGDVPLAPNLSVTFNQPMVALTGPRRSCGAGRARQTLPAAGRQMALDRHEDAGVRAAGHRGHRHCPLPHGDKVHG